MIFLPFSDSVLTFSLIYLLWCNKWQFLTEMVYVRIPVLCPLGNMFHIGTDFFHLINSTSHQRLKKNCWEVFAFCFQWLQQLEALLPLQKQAFHSHSNSKINQNSFVFEKISKRLFVVMKFQVWRNFVFQPVESCVHSQKRFFF